MRQRPAAWLSNLSISSKLLTSFGLVFLVLGLSLAALIWYLSRINSYVERHDRITVPALVTAANMRQQVLQTSLVLTTLVDNQSPTERQAIARQLATLAAEIQSELNRYRTTHAARTHPVLFRMLSRHGRTELADREDTSLARAQQLFDRWQQQRATLHDALLAGRTPDIRRLTRTSQAAIQQLADAFTALIDVNTMITAEMKAEGNALLGQATWVMLALIVWLGTMTAATYAVITTQVAQPLKGLAATADQVAHRNLSAQFEPWPARDEVGRLAQSLGTMLDTLREQTRSLERKTKELESFTYSAAHDLRGPLREIEGFSALLERKYSGQLEPTAQHYLGMIRASTLKLTALIDALLRYSRLEQQSLPKSVVNLRALINEIVTEQTRAAGSTPVLSMHLCFDNLWGEPASIRQALVNVIGNAIKFSRHASPPEISIGGRTTGNEHILWVKDNGIGFDQHDVGRIFRLFERLHAPADYDGTGVGLAIVKLIMEKHGGRVWAESSPGKGSTFYLAFPEKPATA